MTSSEIVSEKYPLGNWQANVGQPVFLNSVSVDTSKAARVDILSWNMAIGRGDLSAALGHLQAQEKINLSERPLVILLQEVYRSGPEVPVLQNKGYHARSLAEADRFDIVEVARELGLNLWYAPSMRNGEHNSDRGNAILSNALLTNPQSFTLPYARQRRVAVSADLPGLYCLSFVSSHLDTHGRQGRMKQAEDLMEKLKISLPENIVLGGDFNTAFGRFDPVFIEILADGFMATSKHNFWYHTFHGFLKLNLDHLFYRSPEKQIEEVIIERVDDRKKCGKRIFGSDHHPLLAKLILQA